MEVEVSTLSFIDLVVVSLIKSYGLYKKFRVPGCDLEGQHSAFFQGCIRVLWVCRRGFKGF